MLTWHPGFVQVSADSWLWMWHCYLKSRWSKEKNLHELRFLSVRNVNNQVWQYTKTQQNDISCPIKSMSGEKIIRKISQSSKCLGKQHSRTSYSKEKDVSSKNHHNHKWGYYKLINSKPLMLSYTTILTALQILRLKIFNFSRCVHLSLVTSGYSLQSLNISLL